MLLEEGDNSKCTSKPGSPADNKLVTMDLTKVDTSYREEADAEQGCMLVEEHLVGNDKNSVASETEEVNESQLPEEG
jgi:hypothetical protein